MKTVIIIALVGAILSDMSRWGTDKDDSTESSIAHLLWIAFDILALIFACIIKIH